MAKLKIAVLGAGSIGKFHVREFLSAGADVVAILGSSQETALKTAEDLHAEYGIRPRGYFDLASLVENEKLDAVSICTPSRLHYAQIKKCLEAGLHVLCEKPLVLNSHADNYGAAKELVEFSEKQGKVLAVNTQWPAVIDYIKDKVDLSRLKTFSMEMQPSVFGVDMLAEQLAHTNSMVVKLIPDGHAEEIKFSKHSPEDIDVYFKYINKKSECDIHYKFTHKVDRPRKVNFTFDGLEFRREIGENYQQRLVTDKAEFDIKDPLKVSIEKFVDAIEGKISPLISKKEIIENMALQDKIIAVYLRP
ncbi:MAG: oxidoreductase domain-containing protein [Parcubacteria group bacterium Gr01-1014_3]|nr:MAG: oxidoreductase domain-containing protein [Parcubacteria group bacterium Gr01-1014_3]